MVTSRHSGKYVLPTFTLTSSSAHRCAPQTFWDSTGQIWAKGGYTGKYAGMFVSSGSAGGGQESTFLSALSTYAHHGIIFVPFGYSHAFPQLTDLTQVHGGLRSLSFFVCTLA
jgi:hypothetical protein